MSIKEQVPALTTTHGMLIVKALIDAAKQAAREDVFTDPVTGQVDFCESEILGATLSDEELRSQLESLFWKIYPAVADEVRYEQLKSWQADKDLEKRLSGLAEIKKLEEV